MNRRTIACLGLSVLMLLVIGVDQAAHSWAQHTLGKSPVAITQVVAPGIQLTWIQAHNLSIQAVRLAEPQTQSVLIYLVEGLDSLISSFLLLIALSCWTRLSPRTQSGWPALTALSVALSADVSNILTYIRYGRSVQYLALTSWEIALNLADIALVSGLSVLLLLVYRHWRSTDLNPVLEPQPRR